MLNKEIIDGTHNIENLKLVPTQDLIKLSSVLLVEMEDKFILLKNRWSHKDKGNLYITITGENDEGISLNDLDYTKYTIKDIAFYLRDFNKVDYLDRQIELHKMLLNNPYVIYKKCK